MISMDKWLFEFIGLNWLTLSAIFGLLTILAKETKWVLDDKIVTFLAGSVRLFKKRPKKEESSKMIESSVKKL